jgi:dihydrofolate reductase
MAKVRVHNLLVTLDGFATGEGQSLTAAFGHAQEQFLHWFDAVHLWRRVGVRPDGPMTVDEAIADLWGQGIGAEIMGRNKFKPSSGPWDPDDDWQGWWGENPPFHTPCFVLTHHPRPPLAMAGGTTFHFLDAFPAEAVELAAQAANGLDVRIGGGPTTVREFLAADLIDHLHVVVVPIVLGRGVRLWDGLEDVQERFDVQTVSTPSGVAHLTFTRKPR